MTRRYRGRPALAPIARGVRLDRRGIGAWRNGTAGLGGVGTRSVEIRRRSMIRAQSETEGERDGGAQRIKKTPRLRSDRDSYPGTILTRAERRAADVSGGA